MTDWIELFFILNLSLLTGYALFRLILWRTDVSLERFRKKHVLFISRLSFVVAILSPLIVLNSGVSTSIPKVSYQDLIPLSEGELANQVRTLEKEKSSVLSTKQVPTRNIGFSYILLIVFVAGVLFRLVQLLRSLLFLRMELNRCVSLRKVGSIKILVSWRALSPFSCLSLFGSRIVIPSDLLNSPVDLRNTLRHEIQHVRQHDVHWVWFYEVAKVVFWFNPGVYLWSRNLEELSELACDQEVLAGRRTDLRSYGKTLIAAAEYSLNQQTFYSATTRMCGSRENSTALLRRIEMLKKSKERISNFWAVAHGAVTVGAILGFALVTRVEARSTEVRTHPGFQRILESSLKKGMRKAEAEEGFAILSNTKTGEILALSQLEREGEKYVAKHDPAFMRRPYESFSTFKPIAAAIAIEKGVVNENTILDATEGRIRINGRYFHDWKTHGMISVKDAIANSSNIGIYRAIESIPDESLYEEIRKMGFGTGGIADGTGFSAPGNIRFSTGPDRGFNHAHIAWGARTAYVTALEIQQIYGALANGGELLKPMPYGSSKPEVVGRILSPETVGQVNRALRRTVTNGTAKNLNNSKYQIAGKTGTGVMSPSRTYKAAKFVGFAPYESPRLVAYVIVLKKGRTHGSKDAAPIVRDILEQGLDYM